MNSWCRSDIQPPCNFLQVLVGCCPDPSIAPVGAPPISVWTTPPASGEDAQQTINALVNQQMIDQQALNAQGVNSSWLDTLLGGGAQVGNSISNFATSPYTLGVLAIVFVGGVLMLGDSGPRRYGR